MTQSATVRSDAGTTAAPPGIRKLKPKVAPLVLAAATLGVCGYYFWTALSMSIPTSESPNYAGNIVERSDDYVPGRPHYGYYNVLADALLHGHTYLQIEPAPEFAQMTDPYDPQQNEPFRLHDASYFHGKYYFYFGVVPAITLFAPFRVLHLGVLSEPAGAAAFCSLGFVFLVLTMRMVTRRCLPATPWALCLIGVACLGLAHPVPFLLRRPAVYEVAIAAGFGYSAGALYFLLSAVLEDRAKLWRLALAGLFMGLAVGSRPHLVVECVVLVGVWLWLVVRRNPWRLTGAVRSGVPLFGPLAVCGILLAIYNYARFGSWTDVGVSYQLAGIRVGNFQFGQYDVRNILPHIYFYCLAPYNLDIFFPFIHLVPFGRVESLYPGTLPNEWVLIEPIAGIWRYAPLLWLLFLLPLIVVILRRSIIRGRAVAGSAANAAPATKQRPNHPAPVAEGRSRAAARRSSNRAASASTPHAPARNQAEPLDTYRAGRLLLVLLGLCGASAIVFATLVIAVPASTIRYEVDFVPVLTLAAVILWLTIHELIKRRWLRLTTNLVATGMIGYGCLFNVAIAFTGYNDLLHAGNPALYAAIEDKSAPIGALISRFNPPADEGAIKTHGPYGWREIDKAPFLLLGRVPAELRFYCPNDGRILFTAKCVPLVMQAGQPILVSCEMNGRDAARWSVNGPTDARAEYPAHKGVNRLSLHVENEGAFAGCGNFGIALAPGGSAAAGTAP